jgi:hypothetical protein
MRQLLAKKKLEASSRRQLRQEKKKELMFSNSSSTPPMRAKKCKDSSISLPTVILTCSFSELMMKRIEEIEMVIY